MKVSVRLLTGFGMLTVLLIAIIALGMNRMAMLNENLRAITDEDNVQAALANELQASALVLGQIVRDVIIETDLAVLKDYQTKTDKEALHFEATLTKLDQSFTAASTTAPERDLAARIHQGLPAWKAAAVETTQLGSKNKNTEAEAVLRKSFVPFGEGIIAACAALSALEGKLGAESAADSVKAYNDARWLLLVLGALAVLIAVIASQLLSRSILGQLGGEPKAVAAVADRVAHGDLSSAIVLRDGDTSSLFATVATMQQRLRERAHEDRARAENELKRIEADRAASAENARIRIALDRVSVGVMLADTDGKIIYANDFGTNIFRRRAPEIRQQLPQFDAERIVGASFDSFHRVPSHQRNMLAGLTGTHISDIKIGAVTLRVIANPVIDGSGQRLGTVVQWLDRTEELGIEEEVQQTVSEAVDGNLTARIREEGKEGFFKTLAGGVNRLIGSTAEVMRTITNAASEVGTGAEEISRGNADLSARTEQQASSLEETAASMEQMTTAVKSNADNAAQANQLARAARDQAEQGGTVVQSAVLAMSEINASSKRIADIIGVIDDIAFQTNLLALNAAVEAARAGEQGRGFAVVASEVRNLASRSAAAAKEIKGLIQESVAKVEDGTKLVYASGKVLQDIVGGVKKVTDVVAEIAASSLEQASGIEQVNMAVMSMDEGTQQNAALVEQATAAAQSLNVQAANLTQMMARFQIGGDIARTPAPVARKVPSKAVPTERRGPNRAFARPTATPKVNVAAPAPLAAAGGAATADWQEF